ncbi:MAG TPA: acetylxylan esterase [Feifaniaceae bacterium]|nr:acetylxylan esterase [Feifaniaceae bacterium]
MLGSITLLLAVLLRAGYTVYCCVRKSEQPALQRAMRFFGLGAVLLLLCLGVFEWGFRWAPLVFVLAVLSIISLIGIFARPKEKPFRRGRAVLAGIGGALLFAIALLPAIVFPQYEHPPVTGQYGVATAEYTYADKTRIERYSAAGENREVNVAFWYPENTEGKFPLVVFSHGFCGVKNSNESAFMELASHGYVVCSIDHPYHSFFTVNAGGKVTTVDAGYMREYAALGDDKAENLKLFQKWMGVRVSDIDFVIDTILQSDGGVYRLVDHTKIGVFGHSLGGAAAMGVPRAREDIDAVINIDAPMMCELTGVENGAYTVNTEPYPVPLLNIYSQYLYDNGIRTDDEMYFENRLVSATAPASYEVVFGGAQHMSLTDLALVSPMLASALDSGRRAEINVNTCLETMNRIILEFFDCYLKDAGSFSSAGTY